MRKLLNILAVISGLFCGLLAITGVLLFAQTVLACFQQNSPLQKPMPLLLPFLLAFTAGFTSLGVILTARAYRHLRQPDRNTANNVAGIATFLLAFVILGRQRKSLLALPGGQFGPIVGLLIFVSAIIAFYLFYRLVMKRIAAQAFPSHASESLP